MKGAHLKDTNNKKPTYYNPVYKEKFKYSGPDGAPRLLRRVRGSIGGNLLFPEGPTSANTAETDVIKSFFNSVVSDNTNMCTMGIKDFYLGTPLPEGDKEYMWLDAVHFTPKIIADYHLQQYVVPHNQSFRILMKVCKTIYGLKNAGALSKRKLDNILSAGGYSEDPNVPCVYTHATNGVTFVLVVDDFCIKYTTSAGRDHLRQTLEQAYEVTLDPKGTKFVGLTITYNRNKRYLEISCPGYFAKVLKRFAHRNITPCATPMKYVPPDYGAHTQYATTDDTKDLTPAEVLEAQKIIGCILWHSRLIDAPTLSAVSKAATSLGDRKASLNAQLDQLLGHLMAFPDNRVRFYASDMILYSYSDRTCVKPSPEAAPAV